MEDAQTPPPTPDHSMGPEAKRLRVNSVLEALKSSPLPATSAGSSSGRVGADPSASLVDDMYAEVESLHDSFAASVDTYVSTQREIDKLY